MARPSYHIFETDRFTGDIGDIGMHALVVRKLREYVYPILKSEPHFGPNIKRLKNWNPPTWRYRIGDWRLFYEINEAEKTVFMTAASHRREAYR